MSDGAKAVESSGRGYGVERLDAPPMGIETGLTVRRERLLRELAFKAGEAGIDALMDPEVQRLAWENHGFRTDVASTAGQLSRFGVEHVAASIAQAVSMPSYETMERIIDVLS